MYKRIIFLLFLFIGFIAIGVVSQRSIPPSSDIVHDVSIQGTKICFDGDNDLLHFAHERIVEMNASHERFSIQRDNNTKTLLPDLLNVKEYDEDYPISQYGHYINSKREGSKITIVIPLFQETCFDVFAEEEAEPLQFNIHIETEMCYITLFFYFVQLILILFCPKGLLFENFFIVVVFLYIVGMTFIHPKLLTYPLYETTISKVTLTLLRYCNLVFLAIAHSLPPFCNMIVYYIKNGITVRSVWEKACVTFETLWTMAKPYVETFIIKLPPKEEVIEFVTTNWKECVVAVILLLVTIYIFYPSHKDYSSQTRLVCVILISLALIYVSSSLAIQVFGFSVTLAACLLILHKVLDKVFKSIKRIISRKKE